MRQGEAFVTTRTEEETEYIGMVVGKALRVPQVISLQGELGTGKTVFVRGAAKGLGVRDHVSSPSFVLLNIYRGILPVYHFDFYRLEEAAELEELGFEEYLPGEGVALVEWGERFPFVMPREWLLVVLERFYDHGGEGRRLWFTPYGDTAAVVETYRDHYLEG